MIVKNKSTAKISNYTYDDLHRLISATITNAKNVQNYVQTYAYDITGNILVKSDLGNYQYNDKNPQAVTRAGNVSYSYDDNGNLLTDGTYTYTWDYKNRLINSQPTAQNPQLKFSYDESGNRVLKENISSGEKTYYVNKFYEVENSQTTSSSKFTKYIYAGDIKVADEIITEDNSLRLTKGKDATTEVKSIKSVFKNIKHKLSGSDESDLTEVIFHHTDHLSGSNVDTDINGNTVEVLDYYPYGNVRLNEKSGDYKNKYKSDYKLTSDELLDAGQKFIGDDYKELGENGSGVYRSADGTKQFRIDDSSLNGQHDPYESHGHLENFDDANDAHPSTINHVIIKNE